MCSNPKSPILAYANEDQRTLFWFRADCKLWTCEECAGKRKTLVAARAGRGADHWIGLGFEVHHITLTASGHWRGQSRSIENFRRNWPKLRKRAQYAQEEFHYAMFAEHHKTDGSMHCHLVACDRLSNRWWKDNAHSAGLGYQSRVRVVRHGGEAARYAVKYISKSLLVERWPNSFHRFRFSSLWPSYTTDFISTEDWRVYISDFGFDDECRHWRSQGYRILNTRTGELTPHA